MNKMNNLGDYLKRKQLDLGMERQDILGDIQAKLDRRYPGATRVLSLQKGVLRIITPNASLSSELRFKQNEIKSWDPAIERIAISVRSL